MYVGGWGDPRAWEFPAHSCVAASNDLDRANVGPNSLPDRVCEEVKLIIRYSTPSSMSSILRTTTCLFHATLCCAHTNTHTHTHIKGSVHMCDRKRDQPRCPCLSWLSNDFSQTKQPISSRSVVNQEKERGHRIVS